MAPAPSTPARPVRAPTPARRAALALPTALVLALGATACGGEETIVEQAEDTPGLQLAEGEQVTIEGEVQEVLAPNAFTVGSDGTLVLSTEVVDVDDGDEVVVTGEVEVFILGDIEERFGIDETDDDDVWETERSVIADEVVVVSEG